MNTTERRPLSAVEGQVTEMPARKENEGRLPGFRSLEEEAQFWETHSPLDYPQEWVEVKRGKAGRQLGHILAVRLDAPTIDKLASLTRKKGIGPSTLARMWLLERLAEAEEQGHKQTTDQSEDRSS